MCKLLPTFILLLAARFAPAESPRPMIALSLGALRLEGTPLAWNQQAILLLGRDGKLHQFHPAEAKDYREAAGSFRAFSHAQMRADLLREFGRAFEVAGTRHYLVVHPAGNRRPWAERFEELYQSFFHYWQIRGLSPRDSEFPLVAVVFGRRDEFRRHAARGGAPPATNVVGYYELASNRVYLYDDPDQDAWQGNADVLIHEATHQTAFNTGIHSRHSPPPTWVSEGLATLFEAPGVHGARAHPRPQDRIHGDWAASFRRRVVAGHSPDRLQGLVASDDMFAADPIAAYAEAWALTYYLVTTEPRRYARYLARTASRTSFRAATAAERTEDFTAVFGENWALLEAQFLRFIERLD